MSTESSSQKRVIWLEPEGDGSPDILFGDGGKVSANEVGEGEGEFVGVIKFNIMGMMSEH